MILEEIIKVAKELKSVEGQLTPIQKIRLTRHTNELKKTKNIIYSKFYSK
tara:strand:+ start:529 stop:678 length:150 start_codon:yes stop_codon:yes gene_type:complete